MTTKQQVTYSHIPMIPVYPNSTLKNIHFEYEPNHYNETYATDNEFTLLLKTIIDCNQSDGYLKQWAKKELANL